MTVDWYTVGLTAGYGFGQSLLAQFMQGRSERRSYRNQLANMQMQDLFSVKQQTKQLETDLQSVYASSGLKASFKPKVKTIKETAEYEISSKYAEMMFKYR